MAGPPSTWFKKGNKAAIGRGVASRAKYMRLVRGAISDDELTGIVAKLKRDALGVHVKAVLSADGQTAGTRVEDDPASNPMTRHMAARILLGYLLGKPLQPLTITEEETVDNVLDKYDDGQINSIIAAGERVAQRIAGRGGSAVGRGSATGEGAPGGGEGSGPVSDGA